MNGRMYFALILFAVLFSCTSRDEATSSYADAIRFGEPRVVPLPASTSYAEKRGFGDFNNDGIEDMLEIKDEKRFSFGQKYSVQIFYGQYDDNGILAFSDEPTKLNLPITMKWFSSATKMDVGDVNGDGYTDIIFTQYTERIGDDRVDIAFAINQAGEAFVTQTENILYKNGISLMQVIHLFVDAQGGYYSETIYDYLKMDWGDVDGNGTDDLILGWDGVHDLYLEVIYTALGTREAQFVDMDEYEIVEFMRNRSIQELDVEDFNGDGRADIFVHFSGWSKNYLAVALNNGEGFTPHKDCVVVDVDLEFFAFEKYDTFDVNRDGRADFVHLGEKNDQKVMAYNLVE